MKKILKSAWLILIIPIITGIISGVITSKIENINFVEALSLIIKKIFSFILNTLTFKIPLWIIIVIVVIIAIIIKIALYLEYNKNEEEMQKENLKKVFRDYTEDEYEGIKYRWEWEEHYNGIEMINLHPICDCGCTFNYSSFDSYLKCPDCKKQYRNNVNLDSAKRVFANRYSKRLKKFKEERK